MKVTVKVLEGHRTLRYRYDANKDLGFDFSLHAEVGQPWQAEAMRKALAIAAKEKSVIRQVELSFYPWYADALVKETTQ